MVVGQVPIPTLLTILPYALAGAISAWLAVRLSREGQGTGSETGPYVDLWRPYVWACAAFAFGVSVFGLVQTQVEAGSTLAVTVTFLFAAPWIVFAFNFAGRGHLLTRRLRAVGALLTGYLLAVTTVQAVGVGEAIPDLIRVLALLASVIALGILGVVFAAASLIVLSTYRHRSLSLAHGGAVILPMGLLILGVQLTRPSTPLVNDVLLSVTAVATAGSLVVATTRYDILGVRPGTGTLGERTAVVEMSEAIVTVERDGRLARENGAARVLFGERLDEGSLEEVLGYDPAALADQDIIECWTDQGQRQFDPRVTELTNRYEEVVGYTVVLIDVTEREIRRQRIEVLNRILRHNIRNKLDVIRADAELVTDDQRAASILETTDALNRLSGDVRRIETLMRRSQGDRPETGLHEILDTVVESVAADHPNAAISLNPPDVSPAVDAGLCRFALRNVVENAVVHNDSDEPRVEVRGEETDAGVRLTVADDGPGIPEPERSVIEKQTESQEAHSRSLGLWGTSWAVQQLGGDLSFQESSLGGTAVRIELPNYE